MRRLLQTCCIFLLLFAQQAALTHLLWHAHRSVSFERLDRSPTETKRYTGTTHLVPLCSFHALLGQVLGAMSCDARSHIERYLTRDAPRRLALELGHRNFLAPLSRGPPFSLVS